MHSPDTSLIKPVAHSTQNYLFVGRMQKHDVLVYIEVFVTLFEK